MITQAITVGSISDVAARAGQTLAETFMSAAALILIDVSLSMEDKDCPDRQARYDVAVRELNRLQAQIPGKVAVVQFHSSPEFRPGGVPDFPRGSTNVEDALKFVLPADAAGIRIILISDGEPDYADGALAVARQFKHAIETVYVGPEGGRGAEFLRRLAAMTGGQAVTQSVREIPNLSATISRLLTA